MHWMLWTASPQDGGPASGACAGSGGWCVTVPCKRCGRVSSLTEQESARIAADLDERYTWEEQASLTFTLICSDCVEWELADLMARYRAGDMRVKVVPASPGPTGGGPPRD
jgi:hypothetical protein